VRGGKERETAHNGLFPDNEPAKLTQVSMYNRHTCGLCCLSRLGGERQRRETTTPQTQPKNFTPGHMGLPQRCPLRTSGGRESTSLWSEFFFLFFSVWSSCAPRCNKRLNRGLQLTLQTLVPSMNRLDQSLHGYVRCFCVPQRILLLTLPYTVLNWPTLSNRMPLVALPGQTRSYSRQAWYAFGLRKLRSIYLRRFLTLHLTYCSNTLCTRVGCT